MYAPETRQTPDLPTLVEDTAIGAEADPTRDQPISAPADRQDSRSGVDVLKVSTRSRPSAVAGAIAGVLRQQACVEVQSIGAGATNQAIKAVVIARAYLRDDHINIGCVPFFIDVAIGGEDRTAIRLLIERFPEAPESPGIDGSVGAPS